ncbi:MULTISPECIES: RagB/SusD family nutrient uptake outer membrane protein [Olivibacter]|jgi:hypothetical protein|uniref:RagB/SusD family nutrient uptake outer membrane protein n=1 Tax=Olivibacter oleidegradans TaxID=760123 RepID=A0ABV6HLY2_9SPHI|nr:RagB/SusD family nutrient uptake outer membrane protein [Olivibacter jilunii]
MKKYWLSICIACTLLVSACSNFLELEPENQINQNNFYKTEKDFETSMVGIYATLKNLYARDIFFITELTTDNAEISIPTSSLAEVEFDEMTLTATNTIIQSAWNSALFTVSRCNVLLNRINEAAIDEIAKNRIAAEARFMRALSYFFLVQAFGNTPVTDAEFNSPAQVFAADITLKPSEEVYQLIISDLLTAESQIPINLNPNKGQVSIGAIKTLLGKVYLTQHNYMDAAAKLKEVIDLGHYSLVDNYKSLFQPSNENLAESIFEFKYTSGVNLGNSYSSLFTPAIIGLLPDRQSGSGRINPTLSLMQAYESGDVRMSASVGDSILTDVGMVYSRYGLKFVDMTTNNPLDGSANFTVLRYADVLLMYAEALNEQGSADANTYLNLVRSRAGLNSFEKNDTEALRQAIAQERRVEFVFEAQRWFDLKRTGKAQEVINAYYAQKGLKFSVEDHELLLPIPRREIEINPKLQQNPGY